MSGGRTTAAGKAAAGEGGWWRRAVSAAEPSGGPAPDWAVFVDAALTAAPRYHRPHGAGGPTVAAPPGMGALAPVLARFAESAAARLPAPPPAARVDLPAVRARFTATLTDTLTRIAARTLVLELHSARDAGRLAGATSAERFDDFVALTAGRSGAHALVTRYPVLGRLLGQAALHAGAALTELLDRFAADRAAITSTLLGGTDPGPLTRIDTAAGDRHRRGRSVAVLRFADGARVVYKPRPLAVDRHFGELVRWFDTTPGSPGLRVPAVLDRGRYGWTEHIAPADCRSEEEVRRFYRRQGALLALLHAVDATDLHCENLIACRDQPVPVDVETLFHPPAPADAGDDPARAALDASVHRIGLLPVLMVGETTAVDASGLGGDAGAPGPARAVDWAEPGTDRMRLVRRAAVLPGAANRPHLHGTPADPARHTEDLVAGFRAAHHTLARHSEHLTGPHGPLRRFAADETRLVARATRVYALLLDESTHPDLLRHAADRDRVLELLRTEDLGGPAHPLLLADELADLRAGDVPFFTTRPGTVDVWNATGHRIPAALDRTALDRVLTRVRALDTAGTTRQEWTIRAAMAARSTADPHRPDPHRPDPHRPGGAQGEASGRRPIDPGRLLDAARAVGERVLDLGLTGGGRTNWLGLGVLGERYWRLQPLGADLGTGYTGVALFLAQLARITGDTRYAEAAHRALRPLPTLLDRLAGAPEDLGAVGSGAFAGLGGISYALAHLAAELDDADLRALLPAAVELTAAAAAAESGAAVLDGTAGGLAALLAVHEATGAPAALHAAEACAARLAVATPPAGTGLALGRAGVTWALDRLRGAPGRSDATSAVRPGGLPGSLDAWAVQDGDARWCHGLAGLVAAARGRPGDDAAAAVRALARTRPPTDHSLCHGELGVLDVLATATTEAAAAEAAPAAAVSEAVAVLARRTDLLLGDLDRDGPVCGTPGAVPCPSLLNGLAGIGHGLLRLGFADRIPSVLLLEPPRTG
ncbi:type 2 lantibiotic biosynthesis protein LanM [Streptomyces sp. TLI_235]|nr:type 2 lanthipeptide synthetase LanM family protein [Streptomyces sp. TLI_235]PBC75389.1 type 2 lantibiotic biosynthesis protein LanM [Streptomyces sp. TLI_235]